MKKPKKTKSIVGKIETVRFYIDETNYYEGKFRVTKVSKDDISFTGIGKLVKKKKKK